MITTYARRTAEQDMTLVRSFATNGPYDHLERTLRWLEWKPAHLGTSTCPRVLAGKRCKYRHDRSPCLCNKYRPPLQDHPRRRISAGGRHLLSYEAYDAYGDDLGGLITDCPATGLTVTVNGCSPRYPGRSLLVIVQDAGARRTSTRSLTRTRFPTEPYLSCPGQGNSGTSAL